MTAPNITERIWIKIKSNENDEGIDGFVFKVFSDEKLSVGYYQNDTKAIKENVVWEGKFWKFQNEGLGGSYLTGSDEAIVKRGPTY